MAKRKLTMEIINPNAAGIDIGSRSQLNDDNGDNSGHARVYQKPRWYLGRIGDDIDGEISLIQ